MRLRQLFREQEQTSEVADVIVFWLEDGETVQHIFYNVPVEEIRKPDFEETLRRIVSRNFNKVLVRYQVVGDTTSQGTRDGQTPDTEVPPILTSRDNEEVPPVEQRPDEIEAPATASRNVEVTVINSRDLELAREYQQERFNAVDQDRDGIHDETGEQLPRINQDGSLTDPETGEVVGAVAGTTYAERLQDALDQGAQTPNNFVGIVGQGGGQDGDTGDEGTEGEEGAVTGEQRAEIPSIIEELRTSLRGLGTNETRMINALKRITSPAHLEAVVQMYRQEYGSSLPQDIIDEFKFDLGDGSSRQVAEINRVMRPLGWEIIGSRYLDMRWQRFEGSE